MTTDETTGADPLAATRRVLHGIAEHLLAAHEFRTIRRIALRVREHGFATLDLPPGTRPSRLELVGSSLVSGQGEAGGDAVPEVPVTGQSLGELAASLGVRFGLPDDAPYRAASGCTVGDPAVLDRDALLRLQAAWADGDAALRRLARDHSPQGPPEPVLWPEHFDVGLILDEVNYGVSPGDDFLPVPYAYVGPWQPRHGDFWNAPFGAAVPVDLSNASRWRGGRWSAGASRSG
jgi:hypothetical protein